MVFGLKARHYTPRASVLRELHTIDDLVLASPHIVCNFNCENNKDPQENRMSNPWLKKNPLMSMWMSGANAVTGAASV